MSTRRLHERLQRVVAACGAVLMSGCYTYVPVEQPTPGTPVRIQVAVPSAVARPNRPPEVIPFEGTVVALNDSVFIETRSRQEVSLHREITVVDTIGAARSSLVALEERVFSKPRTLVFSAALVGAGVAIVLGVTSVTGGDDEEPPGDPPPEASISFPTAWNVLRALFGH